MMSLLGKYWRILKMKAFNKWWYNYDIKNISEYTLPKTSATDAWKAALEWALEMDNKYTDRYQMWLEIKDELNNE